MFIRATRSNITAIARLFVLLSVILHLLHVYLYVPVMQLLHSVYLSSDATITLSLYEPVMQLLHSVYMSQ